MFFQKQKPNEQKCLLYCAAMLLDLDVSVLESVIGSSGEELWWSNFNRPKSLRGIHIQEIQDVFLLHGKCLYPIEKFPMLCPVDDLRFARTIRDINYCEMRFFARVMRNQGILIYESHAKVLYEDSVYDPNGKIFGITVEELSLVKEAWLIAQIKS
jgi:hypothetical protein